jgi:hypothetical protein
MTCTWNSSSLSYEWKKSCQGPSDDEGEIIVKLEIRNPLNLVQNISIIILHTQVERYTFVHLEFMSREEKQQQLDAR